MKYIQCGRRGVYFLLEGSKIVYIGRTSDFPRRVLAHYDKRFDRIRFIPTENNLWYEKRWIKKFKPKYNVITIEHRLQLESLGFRDHVTSKFKNAY